MEQRVASGSSQGVELHTPGVAIVYGGTGSWDRNENNPQAQPDQPRKVLRKTEQNQTKISRKTEIRPKTEQNQTKISGKVERQKSIGISPAPRSSR